MADSVAEEDIDTIILGHVLKGEIDQYQADYLASLRKKHRQGALATILRENGVTVLPTDN